MAGAHQVGPLRVADADVVIETADADFAAVARWSFRDLVARPEDGTAAEHICLEVRHRDTPWSHWGIWRDGEPCETVLTEGYVLFQLQWELNRIVLERRHTTIHAAAVAIDGCSAILCGESMSGKTTLAGAMSAGGAEFVADEIVTVTGEGDVIGYHRPLGLRHNSPLAPLFEHPGDFDRRFDTYEMLVPVSALDGSSITWSTTRVGALIFPRYNGSIAAEIEEIPKSLALSRVCSSSPGFARHGRAAFHDLAAMVRSVPTVELVSSDLDAAGALIGGLLTGVTA